MVDRLVEMASRIELPAVAGDGADGELRSSLPLDDPDFREIVEDFVRRAAEQLDAIDLAWSARDYDQLARLAHWMKGAGGTAGSDAFTGPAKLLHQLARQQDTQQITAVIAELRQLHRRIDLPDAIEPCPTGEGNPVWPTSVGQATNLYASYSDITD
jgi:HPt (histidine-containing phosphotransfer) domain-containing protein